ncbi:MAG: YigZ family protein [Clostridiales bacterium]|jgi:uncharacterized YigZ family protein|nr:YigZ family protein [Clostridiales bacterium]
MTDQFDTVANDIRVKIAVGACRFLASVARTETEEEAKLFIARVSNEFRDATHNAYAYKIGGGEMALARQSDASEPAGTAGTPLLQAIENAGLTNVTVVGTRYFGGVKLGIGGLIRAYGACADAGLAEAGRITEVSLEPLLARVSYDHLGTVLHEVAAAGGEVEGVDYDENGVSVRAKIPRRSMDALSKQLVNLTRGKIDLNFGHTRR